jgi:hypothetical protein
MSGEDVTTWVRRWEGPALLVFLLTAIFMAGGSWLKLESVAARAADAERTAITAGNRISTLEANQMAVRDSLAEIKQSLRDLNNELKARH